LFSAPRPLSNLLSALLEGFCKIEVRHTFGKKKSLLLFFLSKNNLWKVLLDIMLQNGNQLFLENRERRFSKIIYA
jgi:hypothetical protein